MKKQPEQMPEDQRFHDTYLLLKKYRDVVWGLELSVQQVKRRFQMEVGSSIKDFLDSIYLAGVDFSDNGIEEQARSIEKSYQMLKLLETSVNIMRSINTARCTIGCSITATYRPSNIGALMRLSK